MDHLDGFEFFAHYNAAYLAVEVSGVRLRSAQGLDAVTNPAGLRDVLLPTRIQADERLGEWHEPWLRLSPEAAQRLLDALWRAGIRPSDSPSVAPDAHAEVVGAKDAHLADLQRLAFGSDTISVPRALYESLCEVVRPRPHDENDEPERLEPCIGFQVDGDADDGEEVES